jgi:tellurite resistance protein
MDDPGPDFVPRLRREELEALVETMYLVAFADGHFGQAERVHFAVSVERLTGGRMAGDDFDHVLSRIGDDIVHYGRDHVIAAIKRRLAAPLRQVALILAADLAAADGELHPDEQRLLLALARSFDINPAAARELIGGPLDRSV